MYNIAESTSEVPPFPQAAVFSQPLLEVKPMSDPFDKQIDPTIPDRSSGTPGVNSGNVTNAGSASEVPGAAVNPLPGDAAGARRLAGIILQAVPALWGGCWRSMIAS